MADAKDAAQGKAPQTSADWERIQKAAEAEKAALDAQRQVLEARKAFAAAESPPDPQKKALEDQLAAANAAKALADAEKAASEARKAQAEAALAAFKAQFGDVPASGYTGKVDLKDKAGATESALLAAKATATAAGRIVVALPKATAGKDFLLFAASEAPNFQALIAFRAQEVLASRVLTDAVKASHQADSEAPEPQPAAKARELAPLVGAVGVGLDAVNKLLGYFRTDYTVGGVDVALDDSLLVQEVAGRIAGSEDRTVRLPAVYSPGVLADPSSEILNTVKTLAERKLEAQDRVPHHEKVAQRFTDEAAKEAEPAKKEDLQKKAAVHRKAADGLKAAGVVVDGLFAKLTATDEKGAVPLVTASREAAIAESLAKGAYLLLVKLHKSGGSYYTKSNMWTFFGGMPFFHMGGVVAGFVLLEGPSGKVAKSGVVPVHGGFVKAGDLPDHVNQN